MDAQLMSDGIRIGYGGMIGLILGSFLSVLIPRLHFQEEGILGGRSKCSHCKQPLKVYELIPLISYLIQKGRCNNCHAKIPSFHWKMELGTLLLFIALWGKEVDWVSAALLSPLFFAFAFIFFYDYLYKEVHDLILFPAILYALGIALYYHQGIDALLGALAGGGFFGVQYLLSKGRWVGSGDILIGILLGLWLTIHQIHWALLVAYILGSTVGIGLLITKKATASSALPLGPFLVTGALIVYFS